MDISYQNTLDYLYSFVDYSLTHSFPAPENFDLDRLRSFLSYFGNPHLAYPVIHIAGTKGKGSVAAMCASALKVAGYRVGLYTSPHLSDYAERIQLNGNPIAHSELVSLVDEIRPILDQGTQLTTFEITTALAFLYFARAQANAVVAEVGLGGRLDATNVVRPIVTVITSISYDHMAVLGNTLAEIAGEKAGILKPGIPAVVSPQSEDAANVIHRVAAELKSPLIEVKQQYQYELIEHSLQGQSFLLWGDQDRSDNGRKHPVSRLRERTPVKLWIPLLGVHQVENAVTAYAALQVASKLGLPLREGAIQDGFANVKWPGRFEILQVEPPIVVDSAHNRDSARKLRATLDEYFPGRAVILVFGASHDKDIHGMLAELMPRVSHLIFTRSTHPRALEPDLLIEWARNFETVVEIIPAIEDAFNKALKIVDDRSILLVTGSLFVAAGARDTWYNDLTVSSA